MGQVDDVEAVRRDVLKGARLPPPQVEFRRRCTGKRSLRRRVDEHDQTTRLRIRQRPEQDGVEDREDGGIGADAQRQRGQRDGSKTGVLTQHAHSVAQIVEQRIHVPPSA